ncbi:MAG: hypothetical protein ABJB09_06280 [Verrucomicrobiota bacterium]
MNQPFLLHIVERLEGFLAKLPASIQKPVLHELTPLKELFLQQRPPRFVLTGSNKFSVPEVVGAVFNWTSPDTRDVLMEIFRWRPIEIDGRGMIAVLDARGADPNALSNIHAELQREPADIFLHVGDDGGSVEDVDNIAALLGSHPARVIGVVLHAAALDMRNISNGEIHRFGDARAKLQTALQEQRTIREHLLSVVDLSLGSDQAANGEAQLLMSKLARELPNQARVEMIRIARDPAAQIEIAQTLTKSTTAICTAIGAQPIPLADLPILTALQLGMVSGIMYISGRERNLRAATEFVGALGVNVGAGMVLREGARAVLKFFPGWGNVVCGMVAGAGTYAVGRAAIVYFLEGVSLRDARRTYRISRQRSKAEPARPSLVE